MRLYLGLCTNWTTLLSQTFDRAGAEKAYDRFCRTLNEHDLEACFLAYVPVVGIALRKRHIHRQDYDDAMSALAPKLWGLLEKRGLRNPTAYLGVFAEKRVLNYMRDHPLYSRRQNPELDGRVLPRRQLSVPDAVHLEEVIRRTQHRLLQECLDMVRFTGPEGEAAKDAVRVVDKGAEPSPVRLKRKYKLPAQITNFLCQYAKVLVRGVRLRLREETAGMEYYSVVELF